MAAPPQGVAGRRVLLLDDEPLILRAVKRALVANGLEVFTATDPVVAHEIVAREKPDVVVSDLHMPEECGARFLAYVKAEIPGAVRILLSADLEFRPRIGTLEQAEVHSLVGKAQMAKLAGVVVAHLAARGATPSSSDEILEVATRFASSMARPLHEDDCHRGRTTKLTDLLARTVGVSDEERFDARLCAVLHDVGQVAVPELFFARHTALDAEDRAAVERHPASGARIVRAIPSLERTAPAILAHHERHDGSGYPARLPAPSIPTSARLFQVVDAYDAMCVGRPYAAARSHADAIGEIEKSAGTQLDPLLAKAFAAIDFETISRAIAC